MGCDIHLYKEKLVGGEWQTADGWESDDDWIDVPYERRFTDRNYQLFGFLVKGVRSEHEYSFLERGLPFDVCGEVKACSEQWGSDGHSHSYLYLDELRRVWKFLQTQTVTITGEKDKVGLDALKASIASDEETDWYLLYPYCKRSSNPDCVPFELEVPAWFKIGCLKTIIDSFDDVDGDSQRIVFWFDN